MKTPFLGPSAASRSLNAQADRTINLYPEMTPNGKDVGAFFGTPGMLEWADVTSSVRGLHKASSYLYAVAGNSIKKLDTSGTITTLGTIGTSTGRVSMADNGAELLIVDGDSGWIVTLATDVVTEITASGFPTGAQTCTYQDGYFLAESPNSQAFYQSDLYDGLTWDPLNFASKEGGPDFLLNVFSDHQELWLFGAQTIEVWYNAGTSTFAFARIQGAYIETGTSARHSPAKLDNSVFWLGSDKIVYNALGYQPQRVSTHAVENAIGKMPTVSDAYSWVYHQEGHAFYCLTFPTAGQTWCYDVATQMWHERAGLLDGEFIAHPVTCCELFNGFVMVGDEDGKICKLDLDTYTHNGETIKRLRRWGHISNSGANIFFSGLQLFAETGVGLDGVATAPQAMLRWSDDGGHNWSNEHWASLGAIGATKTRAIWRRLGHSKDRVFEIAMTDPVKCAWIGAEVDV